MALFSFPFEPPWEALAQETVTQGGHPCYIFRAQGCNHPQARSEAEARLAAFALRQTRRGQNKG